MLTGIFANTRQQLDSVFDTRLGVWLRKRIPKASQVKLNQGNIFILPTSSGIAFLVVLGMMFIGAVNYESSLSFALFFLLLSLFLLSILHTFRNLSGLEFSGNVADRVFAGSRADIEVVMEKHYRRTHDSIRLGYPDSVVRVADLIESDTARVLLQVPAKKRGLLEPGRLRVETRFPFGFFKAWSLIDLDIHCLVYPQPVACDLDWLLASGMDDGNINIRTGNDDFHGLREYSAGDSLRHVAWKHYARGQGLVTKQYASQVDEHIWLDWEMFTGLDTEQRLSRLCYCVLELEQRGLEYGLRLPDRESAPARGLTHQKKLLEQLALYRLDESRETFGSLA